MKVSASAPKTTSYVINNSLVSMIQPKRTSFDVGIYLQLHRKRVRQALIDRKFHQSFQNFENTAQKHRKGFRGSLRSDRGKQTLEIDKNTFSRTYTEHQVTVAHARTTKSREVTDLKSPASNGTWGVWPHGKYHKPNLMYNISLYRKCRKSDSRQWAMKTLPK